MKYLLYALLICLCLPGQAKAQGEGNIWVYGDFRQFDFNTSPPVNIPNPISVGTGPNVSADICDADGNLLFYTNGDWVWDRNMHVFPALVNGVTGLYNPNPASSSLLYANYTGNAAHTAIVPIKDAPDKYYIFSMAYDGRLYYSIADMSLNNGMGDIVPGQKGIFVADNFVPKMGVVQGCASIWLCVVGKNPDRLVSYEIKDSGLNTQPVTSPAGNFPSWFYTHYTYNYYLKFSPDGRYMAMSCDSMGDGTTDSSGTAHPGGIELYEFEKCSGKFKNPVTIDSTRGYADVCFSPDGTKLYGVSERFTYQFDLGQPDLASIQASKTLIITNLQTIIPRINLCIDTTYFPSIQIMAGPDGRIYIDNGVIAPTCTSVASIYYSQYPAFHIILNPNEAGLACNPEIDAVQLSGPHRKFPMDVVMPPPPRDTLTSYAQLAMCAGALLQADTPGGCYHWNTGSDSSSTIVDTSGQYIVTWGGADCTYHIDTFNVMIPPLPDVPLLQYGCPGDIGISIQNKEGDTGTYTYNLYNADSSLHLVQSGNAGYSLSGLDAGIYHLQVTTAAGCDTAFTIQLSAYPVPEITASPADTLIRYGDSIRLHATGAVQYSWSPGGSLDNAAIGDPLATPLNATAYMVVGLNEYGCADTGYVRVDIDYAMPDAVPNAFSPNGDGLNDIFKIEGITYQKILQFRVFNRFGEEVFSTTNPQKGWDGSYGGKPCDVGTYYYYIQLAYPDGLTKNYKGDVLLIR